MIKKNKAQRDYLLKKKIFFHNIVTLSYKKSQTNKPKEKV